MNTKQHCFTGWQAFIAGALLFCASAIAANGPDSKKFNLDDGVGTHGYDPVSYFAAKTPTEGKKEITFKDGDVTYRFTNLENLTAFKKDPKKYVPRYGGWCAYAMANGDFVDVDPKSFKISDGKLLLFYKGIWGNTLEKWNKDETSLYSKAEENWMKLFPGVK